MSRKHAFAAQTVLGLLLSVCALSSAATVTINEYPAAPGTHEPMAIAPGSDGALWFTDFLGNRIERITTAGAVAAYPISGPQPAEITAGPDGALWFTEFGGNKIGRITTAGLVTNEYSAGLTPNSFPFGIVAGPDGALWFTESAGNRIGRITTAGTITEYNTGLTANSGPYGITLGPDGALWFTEFNANQIGRITTGGTITEYPIATGPGQPYAIAQGPDGALWFTQTQGSAIGRITTAGIVTEFSAGLTPNADLSGIVAGPDNALWFTEALTNKIGRITVFGAITEYTTGITPGSQPVGITLGPDAALWFTELANNKIGHVVLPPPLLNITKSHGTDFLLGQQNAQYTVTVTNTGAGPTTSPVTVTEMIPPGLTLAAMFGFGWNCSIPTCTEANTLQAGAAYDPITVVVDVLPTAPSTVINQVTISGGGSASTNTTDPTTIDSICSYSFPGSPASAGPGASPGSAALVTNLPGCPYTSVASNNPWITIAGPASGPGSGSIGYNVGANPGEQRTGTFTVFDNSLSVATFTINQSAASCSGTVTPAAFTFNYTGGSGAVNFNAVCQFAITGNPSWITLNPSSGSGDHFNFTVQPISGTGATQSAVLNVTTVGNSGAQTVAITQTGSTPATGLVCSYSIADATGGVSQSFTSSGSGTIQVTASPQICPWTATVIGSPSFITLTGNTSGTGNGSVSYTAAANSTPNSQSGAIVIAGLHYVISEPPLNTPSYSCNVSNGTAPPVRPEGFAERVADIVFTCVGQAPAAGLTGDVRVSFNTGVTNLLLSAGQCSSLSTDQCTGKTDALLLEDDPANPALGVNAFRGILSSANGTPAVAILFPGVPLAVSGGTLNHKWRITNARVNAHALSSGGGIAATVSILSTSPFTVSPSPVTVAAVSVPGQMPLPSSFMAGPVQTIQPLTFQEGFETGFQPRMAGNNSTLGATYLSESGYVNASAFGAQTGAATSGTRLIVSVAGVPPGVSVLASAGPMGGGSGTNASLVSADSSGSQGFPVSGTTEFSGVIYQPVTLTSGAGTATWEMTQSNSGSIDTMSFNLLLVNPGNADLSGISYNRALAPVSSGTLPGANLPVPRLASSTVVVAPPPTVGLSLNMVSASAQQAAQGQSERLIAGAVPDLAPAPFPSSCAGLVVAPTICPTQTSFGIGNTGQSGTASPMNLSGTMSIQKLVVGSTVPATAQIASCVFNDQQGTCSPDPTGTSLTWTYPSLDGQTTATLNVQFMGTGMLELNGCAGSDSPNSNAAGCLTANQDIGLNLTVNQMTVAPGGTGIFTVSVANGGSEATTDPVVVTEFLPMNWTLQSMTAAPGSAWNCTTVANSCFRNDALGRNGSFDAITVTASVPQNATGNPVNLVSLQSGTITAAYALPTTLTKLSSMTANAGTTPQSALIITAFANTLAVTVKDAGNNPVSGVNVTFTAPGSGASGVFSNATATIVVATNGSGVAAAPFTANSTAGGPYNVTAAATGLPTVNFALTNTHGPAVSMTANAGTTPQSAVINTAFTNPLAVTVNDAGNNPVPGVNVTFTAPGGASGVFSNATATIVVATNAAGVATAPFTANATAGGPYTVAATATGLPTVNFSLTNTALSMTANAGSTPQSASVSTAFANPLAVTVKDAGNNAISGVNVTFTAPGSGASGVFSNGTATIVVATNASGVASAPFTANATAGGPYNVTAAATGLPTVNFALTNTAPTMTANSGSTPQSALVSTAFTNPLAVTVKNGNNPISGVNVTFTAPGSGASGVFSNGTATIVVATNASGVASASFTANATVGGPYNVTAAATGLPTVNFALTNTFPGAVAAVTNVTSSTPNGTYGRPTVISIQVTFSGLVTVTGTPQLALNSGGAAIYSSGSGTATLTLLYAIGSNDSTSHLDYASPGALTLNGGSIKDGVENNANLTLPGPGSPGSLGANTAIFIGMAVNPPATFFTGEVSLGSNVYYLQFPNGNLFGYYNYTSSFPIFYHYDMGFEGFVDGGNGSAYLYDFLSGHWWYTSSSLFPYLYDFTLNSWLFYFPDSKNPGHYTSSPRSFADLATGKIITF